MSPFASSPSTSRHSPSPLITSPFQVGKPVWLLRAEEGSKAQVLGRHLGRAVRRQRLLRGTGAAAGPRPAVVSGVLRCQ